MTRPEDIEAAAAAWASRRDRGEWSRDDQIAFDAWLSQSTAHRVALLRLEKVWRDIDGIEDADEVEAPPPSWFARIGGKRLWMGALAASLLLVAVGLGTQYLLRPGIMIETAVGAQTQRILADGSRVTLNTDSRALAHIDERTREVWLDRGEAYFDVAHDPAHPFIVHAGARRVTVLGTKFSVRNEGGGFRLVVEEGRVRVEDMAGPEARRMLMTRGDVAVAEGNDILVTRDSPEALDRTLAWRQGLLIFDETTLGDAAEEFNRYNSRKFVITDEAARAVRIGGRFETRNVEGFARLLQIGFNLRIEQRGNEILISS